MSPIAQFFHNVVLHATVTGWVTAQAIKVILAVRQERRFDFRWFVGTGGMPSAHSAGVSALAIGVGIEEGFQTPLFAIALMFALVTMFDAQGVRRSAGRQAIALNRIFDELYVRGQISEEPLKELIGHTPVEVITGSLIGAGVAMLICLG